MEKEELSGRTEEEENYLTIILSSASSDAPNRVYSPLWSLYWGRQHWYQLQCVCVCVGPVGGWRKRREKDQIDAQHGAASLKLLDFVCVSL